MCSYSKRFVLILFIIFWCVKLDESRKTSLPQNHNERIVGGYIVKNLEQIPFIVSVQYSHEHRCGGSFISNQWVITAAHCLITQDLSELTIRAGSIDSTKGGIVIQVIEAVQHPKYEGLDYDLALLQLESWSPDGIVFQAVMLPRQREDVRDGTILTTAGWGRICELCKDTTVLRAVEIPKFNQQKCSKAHKDNGEITSRMICAGYPQGAKDSCYGDSGGPLFFRGKLFGIVSWGHGCARENYPGVYSRVASVRKWIKSETGV